jgi:hypothetical protein
VRYLREKNKLPSCINLVLINGVNFIKRLNKKTLITIKLGQTF